MRRGQVAGATLDAGAAEEVAALSAFTAAVSVIVFYLLPRWDVPNGEANTTEILRSVGFSKKVTLGELGEVVNNPDLVMRVQLFHGRDSRPFRLLSEPLFRGTTVSAYHNGSWTQPDYKGANTLPNARRMPYVRHAHHRRADRRGRTVLHLSVVCPAS